ncbi:translin-associated factor TraX, putative [Paecilomyces variotii No. 5]|uniref:Translin-associated factor TraX, putative n=1 Tax=Byssochlamys spectabilis (strain No. 5 / NBRC 109023) TaxID=1356009 RepID=V5FFH4_BYSSN|nr:translin-associated factor TraX, putative [Paecilomyces variotii No. 5]
MANNNKPETAATESSTPLQSIFENFRNELDEHHDRRERVIKTSRDITALSKKIIFSLQRLRKINAPLPPSIAKENKTRFHQIIELFRNIVPDVSGINAWRYQRQISGGIQEFIEAVSFQHYVQTQKLISRDEVAAQLPSEILVTEEDYLMGLFDLTGEMMRFAVTTLSTGGVQKQQKHVVDTDQPISNVDGAAESKTSEEGLPAAPELPILPAQQANIVVDLREIRSLFESLNVPRRHNMLRDMYKKVEVMQNSVEKVERAAYGILVRGSEKPKGWMPDLSGSSAREEVESF